MARRRKSDTLDAILHEMIEGGGEKYSVEQLSEMLGVQAYLMYQWANPAHERRFPLALVLPLTINTGDTSIIEHLAARAGLVVFRVRKRGKSRLEQAEDLLQYQQFFAELLKSLIEVFKNNGRIDKRETLKGIDKFMSTLAGLRQDVENLSDQLDLGLDE